MNEIKFLMITACNGRLRIALNSNHPVRWGGAPTYCYGTVEELMKLDYGLAEAFIAGEWVQILPTPKHKVILTIELETESEKISNEMVSEVFEEGLKDELEAHFGYSFGDEKVAIKSISIASS